MNSKRLALLELRCANTPNDQFITIYREDLIDIISDIRRLYALRDAAIASLDAVDGVNATRACAGVEYSHEKHAASLSAQYNADALRDKLVDAERKAAGK